MTVDGNGVWGGQRAQEKAVREQGRKPAQRAAAEVKGKCIGAWLTGLHC